MLFVERLQQLLYNETLNGSGLNMVNMVLKRLVSPPQSSASQKVTPLLFRLLIFLDRAVKKFVNALLLCSPDFFLSW